MDDDRRTSIETALRGYQATVLQHNLDLLRILTDGMEDQPDPPGWPAHIAQRRRLQVFEQTYLTGSLPESVSTPRDLFADNVRSELIENWDFDGVSHLPVDLQATTDWFAAMQAGILEQMQKHEQNVDVANFPPADLQYLCTLVQSVNGPGLPYHRERQQFALVSPPEDHDRDETMERVTVPIRDGEGFNALTDIWDDWEIAVACKIGDGPRSWGGSYVLFCRNEEAEEWKWRYAVHDEGWFSDVYSNIEEYLDFYAHCKERTEERTRKDIRSLKAMI